METKKNLAYSMIRMRILMAKDAKGDEHIRNEYLDEALGMIMMAYMLRAISEEDMKELSKDCTFARIGAWNYMERRENEE